MTEEGTHPISKALAKLIQISQRMIVQYQDKMWADVEEAAEEEMKSSHLEWNQGWRLDIANSCFVQIKGPVPPEDE